MEERQIRLTPPRVPLAARIALTLLALLLAACQVEEVAVVPAQMPAVGQPVADPGGGLLPPTWTPAPPAIASAPMRSISGGVRPALPGQIVPTNTPLQPSPMTSVPITPRPTNTPSPTATRLTRLRMDEYALSEPLPLEVYPRPAGDNGWGMHWIPTVVQEPAVVDQFVDQLIRMHIRWAVFLNDGANIGDNDYLVERLVAAGIMPVMRIYRVDTSHYDQDLRPMVAHYRAKGVYYYQLYNEPNVNDENRQGFSNPNQYARAWSVAARQVLASGGLPGIGAFSPGGSYDHYLFLERTIQALAGAGESALLNRAWLSVHNYHGLRAQDDENGFLLFRAYDEIIRDQLGRSLPMIGTEAGSYSSDEQQEKELIIWQYRYMGAAEPYFFAFSYWLLANQDGGSRDGRWEYQALFSGGVAHPVVADFFYRNRQ
jgi:hypothetical protein